MSSAFLQIADAVQADLQQSPAVAAVIGRQRRRRLGDDQDTAVNVFLGRSRAVVRYVGSTTPMECDTLLQIECIARAGANTTPDAAVDPLWQTVHARLLASAALRSMGVQLDDNVQLDWDQIEDDERIGAVLLTYRATHQSAITL